MKGRYVAMRATRGDLTASGRGMTVTDAVGARRARLAVGLIILAFLLAASPFVLHQFLTANWDEARYTFAAARMMETGNYIVPVSPWGEVRLLKPPLAYYLIVAGFTLFGQSVFGAKVFWLASAAAILWLTGRLARAIGATPLGAVVAVAALAANLMFFQATLTHIPDIPMSLGLGVAVLAFVRILQGDPPAWVCYVAWGGIAWAFLAKGLLALVVLALALAVRAATHGRRRPSAHELVAAFVFTGLVLSWCVAAYVAEPDAFVAQFLGDQVTAKASFDPLKAAWFLVDNSFDLLVGFVPVALLLLVVRLPRLCRPAPEIVFLWLLIALVVLLFSLGQARSYRYMLPAMPLVAALFGLAVGRAAEADIQRQARRSARLLLAFPVFLGLLTVAVVHAAADAASAAFCLLGVGVLTVLLWRGAGRLPATGVLVLVAAIPTATVPTIYPAYRVLASPTATDIAVDALDTAPVEGPILVVGKWQLIERIGLRRPPIGQYRFAREVTVENLRDAELVIAERKEDAEKLAALGFEVEAHRGAPGEFPLSALVAAIRAQDLDALRERYGDHVYIARPRG